MNASASPLIDRRALLRGAGGIGLALAVGAQGGVAFAQYAPQAPLPMVGPSLFTTWLRMRPDGGVVLVHAEVEYGQGTATANAMLLAEELDVDWGTISIVPSGAEAIYTNPRSRRLSTDGSYGMRGRYDQMRILGATARELFKAAAARRWGVPAGELTTASGTVTHAGSGRSARYVELIGLAAGLPIPQDVKLRTPAQWRLIGKSHDRIDARAKSTGAALYAIDCAAPDLPPGLLHAAIARSPVLQGTVKSFDAAKAKARRGVRRVIALPFGVAVLADDTWTARKAAEDVSVVWDTSVADRVSSGTIAKDFATALETGTLVEAKKVGDVAAAAATSGATIVKADYAVPYLAHMCTEPTNAIAWVRNGKADFWTPTASMENVLTCTKWLLGIEEKDIVIHRADYVGGSFGLRGRVDAELEAAWLSKAAGGVPVSVVRTREDDTANGWYRPYQQTHIEVALAADGSILGWDQKTAVQAINGHFSDELARFGTDMAKVNAANREKSAFFRMAVDYYATSGSILSVGYKTGALRVRGIEMQAPVGVIHWRSVGYSGNMYVLESMIDELAAAAKIDPLAYRRALYAGKPRQLAVLDRLVKETGWPTPPKPGSAWGMAFGESFDSYSAAAIALSVKDKAITIEKVVLVCDQGTTVNPDQTLSQVQGSVIDGLATALWGEITIADGKVEQTNYDGYRLMTLKDVPPMDIHIVDSTERPGSLTEAVTPMLIPALTNALAAATGTRIRELPLTKAGYDLA